MHHWFGELARTPADVDLECFERPFVPEEGVEEDEEEWRGDGHGRRGEYESLVDLGKAMCRYAAISSRRHRWRDDADPPLVELEPTEAPADGANLWTYGTPGERYYAGWTWHEGPKQRRTGRLQIDVAQAGSYTLDEIAVADVRLEAPGGETFAFA